MNVRKKRMLESKKQEPTCANCFACLKGSEFCHLTEKDLESKKDLKKKET